VAARVRIPLGLRRRRRAHCRDLVSVAASYVVAVVPSVPETDVVVADGEA
jgi:hypothetical protein